MTQSWQDTDRFDENNFQLSILNDNQKLKQKSCSYLQNFWREINRLVKEWQDDNETMQLMEYIEHYAPENICNDETYEIDYPDHLNAELVESQIKENFKNEGTI